MFVANIRKVNKTTRQQVNKIFKIKNLICYIAFSFLKSHLRQVKKYIEEYGEEYKFRVVYLEI